jgi:hypothetical protein
LGGILDGNAHGTPLTKDFHLAFLLVSGLTLLAVADCFTLEPDAGSAVSGHRVRPVEEKTPAAT